MTEKRVYDVLYVEDLLKRIAELEALLNEPTLADKLKNLGYKPHGKGIYIAALQEVSDG